jgi:tRNA threonylcarbamoyladenosine biosynthesis protein TsaB
MLLAVDTSTQMMGLALYDGAQVVGEVIWQTHSHHTVELAPAIDELFKRCHVSPTDLTALGVARGPGSFTSLRIGLAIVKGLALALHLPVIGIPTLDILAAAQPVRDIPLTTVLQAGRARLAVGKYRANKGHWEAQGDLQTMTLEALEESIQDATLVCGELNEEARQLLSHRRKLIQLASPAQSVRRPAVLAELAWQRWHAGHADEVISLAPIYLHVAGAIPD